MRISDWSSDVCSSDLLSRLVEHGILMRTAMPEDRRKIEYRLTAKGAALLPTMIALRQWGERWETGIAATPVLVDARDRRPIGPIEVLPYDDRVLTQQEVIWSMPEDVAEHAAEEHGTAHR